MRSVITGTLLAALLGCGTPLWAQETAAKGRIVSVGLFKNGLVLVKQEVTAPKPGVYRLEDVPEPVHGTYWVQSERTVETSVQTREVEVAADQPPAASLQQELAGKKVVLHFKEDKHPALSGTVVKFKRPPTPPEYVDPRYAYRAAAGEPQLTGYLILQTAKGRVYLSEAEIGSIEVEGLGEKGTQRRPVLFLDVKGEAKGADPIYLTYLAHGLTWASSYRVDITDPSKLTLELGATIKNELSDLNDAEFRLISGFPSVRFAHVISLLAPHSSLFSFFQEAGRSPEQGSVLHSQVVSNSMMNYEPPLRPGLSLSATPAGEGVDLHYHPIGKRTLAKGDALALTVARAKAPYERVVEWVVAEEKDRNPGDGEEVGAWDALWFKNPFPFPMTTGPAVVMADGRFNGQRLSVWANAGEETSLRITKALSVRTRSFEEAEPRKNDAEIYHIGNYTYRKVTVRGELAASNHRNEGIRLVIRRRFSGDLLNADGEPASTVRDEDVTAVNRRRELLWNFTLRPGEERRLTYRYVTLVRE